MRINSVKQSNGGNGGSRGISKKTVLWLSLGFSVGCLFSSVMKTADILQEFQVASAGGGGGSSSSSTNISTINSNEDKSNRFSKYFQTYRYILPAKREDMQNVALPAKECGPGPSFDPWWKLSTKAGRSRLGEDKFIYETFFKNQASDFKGTYVELGAFDGWEESNTRFFDVCLGWKGLLIEGNPGNYQKTVSNRPYAHKMSLAPSCSAEFEAVNKTIQFYKYPMTNVGLVGHAKSYAEKPTVDVPCGPLSPIFEDMFADDTDNGSGSGLPTLDFFSLDVEGAEMLVLSTIDFQAVRINVLMIEIANNFCRGNHCQVRKDVRAKMAAEGYKRYEGVVQNSDVYVHPESPFQIPESIAMPK